MTLLRGHYGKLAATVLLAVVRSGVWKGLPVRLDPIGEKDNEAVSLLVCGMQLSRRAGCRGVP
jgi:hypothetical protein